MKQSDLEREARRVLEPLRYSPVGISSPNEFEAGRRTTVPRLAALIETVPQQRALNLRRRKWLKRARVASGTGLALAAAVLLWLNTGSEAAAPPGGVPQLVLLNGQLSQQGTRLSTGVKYTIATLGRLSTPVGHAAKFVTNEGVKIDVGADSSADLSFTGETRRIALNRGKIQLSVPKLQQGTSLSVATPDAIVNVHGTKFSVAVTGETSCVRVSEGVVSVTRGATLERLTRGDTSGCHKPAPATAPIESERARAAAPPIDARRPPVKPKSVGTLTQENRLFQSALAAEQAGDDRQAAMLARQLLKRFPSSPMAPEARRILQRLPDKRSPAEKAR